MGFNPRRFRSAANEGEVAALDRMVPELSAEIGLGRRRTGEDQKPARVAVQPVYGPNAAGAARAGPGKQPRQPIGQARREEAACPFAELRQFLAVPHGRQARGLVHDNDVVVQVADSDFSRGTLMPSHRRRADGDALASGEPAAGVGADGAVHLDPAGAYQLPRCVAGQTQPLPEQGTERPTGLAA